MKRMVVALIGAALVITPMTRQASTQEQRLHLKVAIPGHQPKLIMPSSNSIELSALSMERDDQSVMHLQGKAEIKFEIGLGRVAVIRSDRATYNLNTGEIHALTSLRITEERAH
jgi:hypothetical protein